MIVSTFDFSFYERNEPENGQEAPTRAQGEPVNSTTMVREFEGRPTVAELTAAFRTFLVKSGFAQ